MNDIPQKDLPAVEAVEDRIRRLFGHDCAETCQDGCGVNEGLEKLGTALFLMGARAAYRRAGQDAKATTAYIDELLSEVNDD